MFVLSCAKKTNSRATMGDSSTAKINPSLPTILERCATVVPVLAPRYKIVLPCLKGNCLSPLCSAADTLLVVGSQREYVPAGFLVNSFF